MKQQRDNKTAQKPAAAVAPGPLRILIADDHAIVRQGLRRIVSSGFGEAIVGEAGDAQAVLKAVREQNWDVLVLDITMPGRSGIDVLKDIKALRPKLPVLILSVGAEDQYGPRVLKAGAAGFIGKEKAPEELIDAIKRVVAGGRYASPALLEKMAFDSAADMKPHEILSDREYEVMCMIAAGKKISDIAKTLHLGTNTVNTYRQRVLEKMGMKSNAELIRYCINNKLIP
ncbi:MAG TPA: response regulator transcription factor [Candidatus Acidoferrales bacterium]|nr:response regulator transcription factor [Candidatus Acidoferrales bacterium]